MESTILRHGPDICGDFEEITPKYVSILEDMLSENLSMGFHAIYGLKQPAQLQRLANILTLVHLSH